MAATVPTPDAENGRGDEVRAGYGRAWFSARGANTILAILLLGNIAVTVWSIREADTTMRVGHDHIIVAFEQMAAQLLAQNADRRREHLVLQLGMDKLSCIFSLNDADRARFRAAPGSWRRWCWWVDDDSIVNPR